MKRYFAIVVIIFTTISGWGQNLVNNPSFEMGFASWYYVLSVDYGCGNGYGDGQSRQSDGNCSVGVRFYHYTIWDFEENYQEYLCQKVTGELTANQHYKVSFKYVLADCCSTATNSMGVGFFTNYSTDHDYNWTRVKSKNPELKNDPSNILDNNVDFEEFSGVYKATGQEQWFAIGAFQQDSGMLRVPCPDYTYEWEPTPEIYYYIDEVKIIPCIGFADEQITNEQEIACEPENIHISVNTANAVYQWSNGDTTQSIDIIANNETLWVDVTKNGCTVRDSIKIQLFSGPFDLGEDILVCEGTPPEILSASSSIGETLKWNNNSSENIIAADVDGTYWVTKSLGGCAYTDSINVEFIGEETMLYPNPYAYTFSFSEGDEVMIKEVVSEDGKYLFTGFESLENLQGLFRYLPTGQYYLSVEINGCETDRTIVKVSMP